MSFCAILFGTDVDVEHTAYLCDRSEASTIPTLLVAPSQAAKNGERDRPAYNSSGDHNVRFHEGTWVAVDDEADGEYYDEDDDWAEYDDIDPQAAYYKSLLGRYNTLRNTLANADRKELAALTKANPDQYANVILPHTKSDWRYTFDNKYPTPAMIAQLDDKGLYRALEYVSEVLIIGDTISKQKSCWLWALLALAGDSGTLDYYKVGRIRELGHKAGQLSIRLRRGERRDAYRSQEDDAEDGEVSVHGYEELGAQESSFVPEDRVEDDVTDEDEDNYEPPVDIGGQFDGPTEGQTHGRPARPAKTAEQDDMSSSDDEGEIPDDEEDAPADLEAARARLLAQLGDNLVSDSIPNPRIPAHQLKGKGEAHKEPRTGMSHRHNGKRCHDPSCKTIKARQEAQRKANLRTSQVAETNGSSATVSKSSTQAEKPVGTLRGERPGTQPKRTHEEALAEARKQAMSMPQDTDPAAFLAYLDPELRRAVLANQNGGVAELEAGDECEERVEVTDKRPDVDVDVNTKVTIDMILTVVGECYGQRDLLAHREVW